MREAILDRPSDEMAKPSPSEERWVRVTLGSVTDLFLREETTTQTYLERFGFSPTIIQRFFEPFFGGVFLEKELVTSSRYFEFLFRMFSTGAGAVPSAGMQAIPGQLAARLQPGTMLLNTRVTRDLGPWEKRIHSA